MHFKTLRARTPKSGIVRKNNVPAVLADQPPIGQDGHWREHAIDNAIGTAVFFLRDVGLTHLVANIIFASKRSGECTQIHCGQSVWHPTFSAITNVLDVQARWRQGKHVLGTANGMSPVPPRACDYLRAITSTRMFGALRSVAVTRARGGGRVEQDSSPSLCGVAITYQMIPHPAGNVFHITETIPTVRRRVVEIHRTCVPPHPCSSHCGALGLRDNIKRLDAENRIGCCGLD